MLLIGLLLHLHAVHAGCIITPDSSGHVNYPLGEVAIADSAFSGCSSLRTISIPASVLSIGSSAAPLLRAD